MILIYVISNNCGNLRRKLKQNKIALYNELMFLIIIYLPSQIIEIQQVISVI